MNRYVIVVDDDIDPTNLDEVFWAVCTRSDPATDIEVMRKCWGSRANPLLLDPDAPYTGRVVIDACIPFERKREFPRVAEADPAFLAEISRKWSGLFGER
jgi:4-hydroxy-3-polyprenylbenzoate decarboxylase